MYLTHSPRVNDRISGHSPADMIKRRALMRIVGKTMQESPIYDRKDPEQIPDGRKWEYMGSKWDDKPSGYEDLTYYQLRWRAATARVCDGWQYSMIRKKFRVSDGFIRKWSADIRRISPAEAETQMLRFLDRDLDEIRFRQAQKHRQSRS